MIVCLCHVVSDKTIRETIAAGAATVKEVATACSAGKSCGACCPMISQMIRDPKVQDNPVAHVSRCFDRCKPLSTRSALRQVG
jgi:bacterioferritin-associated ferredoxin